jgi:hypothetical protein
MLLRAFRLFVILGLCGWAGAAQAAAGRATPLPLESDPQLGPLFTKGVESLANQRFSEALRTFEDLYRQSPRPTLLYYLGKVALGEQRNVAAADLYRRFIKGSGDDIDPDTKLEVQQYLATAPPADCEVSVQGDAGALLLVDGRVSGSLPLEQPLALPSGRHQLRLESGRHKVESQLQLLPRRRAEVRFSFVPPLALVTLTPGVLVVMRMDPPTLEPTLAPQLNSAMQTAIGQQNMAMIPPEAEAELVGKSPELASCLHQSSCLERLGEQAKAQFVLYLDVQSESAPAGRPGSQGGVFRFTAKLIDVDVGTVSIQATQSCADCQLKRAVSQLAETVQELLKQAAARPRGVLAVDSQPPGAVVQLDGHTLGRTPYRRDAFVGRHELTLTLAGHAEHTETVVIADNETVAQSVALTPVAAPPSAAARARRIAKWSLLGAGVISTVIGATLIGLNRSDSCQPGSLAGSSCAGFDGRSSGVPLLLLGVGALGGAGVLFYLDHQAASGSASGSSPPAGPAAAASLPLLRF